MIVLQNVNKIYGKGDNSVHALKDVNLVIEDAKFTAILGSRDHAGEIQRQYSLIPYRKRYVP